jgi:glycosyltransferase involved in cell wall biosynthesis
MVDEAVRVAGIAPARVTLIPNPAFDANIFMRLAAVPPATAGRRFLAIGRLAPQKDFGSLVAAFARTGRADDRLTILGEGPEHAALTAAIARHGLAGRVVLAGFHRDVAPWLAAADALILSSRYEGLPAAVLEAMAAGRPVIATDCCVAMRPLLDDGRHGILVPPGDIAALADAIAAFDPAGYDSDAARAVAARHITDRVADRYLRLFRAVARMPAAVQ